MLSEAYELGEQDALDYAIKLAEKEDKPGLAKRLKEFAGAKYRGAHTFGEKHLPGTYKRMRAHKGKLQAGAAGAAGIAAGAGGYAAYKRNQGGKKKR